MESRCPLDPNAPEAWEAGDLNKMFEKLTSEPYKSQYSVEILSSPATDGPWVIQMENVVSEKEAQRLIELGQELGYERSTDVGAVKADGTLGKDVNEGRTSTNAWCDGICDEDEHSRAVIERLSELTGIPETNSEHLQLLRYETGQKYQTHHDYIPYHAKRQGGPRILTVYLYLNDVAEGGGTNFDKLDITVMPKRGRVLLWPSTLDEYPDQKEERTTHQALPVESGSKFGANSWFHLRDFKSALEHGCM
jgi:prolyl 4-hydroxylase